MEEPIAEATAPDLGAQIRRRRRQRGLTLEALASASGVSKAMLSEVERSIKNPTVRLAWQVARALDCTLTELLGEPPGIPTRIVRAPQRAALRDPDSGVERYGISTPLAAGGLEVVTYRIPAGAGTGEMRPNRSGVIEHIVLHTGRLTLRLGSEIVLLQPGDHITYGPQQPVEYRNDGNEPCEFVLLSDARAAASTSPC